MEIAAKGPEEELLKNPRGIAFDRNKNILCCDTSGSRVVVYSAYPKCKFIRAFGTRGNKPGQFVSPASVAVNPDTEEIIVVDQGYNNLVILWY